MLITRSRAAASLMAVVAALSSAPAPCRAQDTTGHGGRIVGRIVDSASHPIAGAAVSVDSLAASATSDRSGRFQLDGVPAGDRILRIRRIGLAPLSVHVSAVAGQTTTVTVRAPAIPVVLPTVTTKTVGLYGKPVRLANTMKYDGFYERRSASSGGGRFYTHEDLVGMDPENLLDVLRRAPGVRLWDAGSTITLRFTTCGAGGILIKLDGQPLTHPSGHTLFSSSSDDDAGALSDVLQFIGRWRLNQIEAVEVYPTSGSLPVDARGNACAAIYIWSR